MLLIGHELRTGEDQQTDVEKRGYPTVVGTLIVGFFQAILEDLAVGRVVIEFEVVEQRRRFGEEEHAE